MSTGLWLLALFCFGDYVLHGSACDARTRKKVSDFAAQKGLSPCARTSTRDERAPEAFIFMDGYALHPEAFTDLDDIAAHKEQDSADAALGLVDDICRAMKAWWLFPSRGFAALI